MFCQRKLNTFMLITGAYLIITPCYQAHGFLKYYQASIMLKGIPIHSVYGANPELAFANLYRHLFSTKHDDFLKYKPGKDE